MIYPSTLDYVPSRPTYVKPCEKRDRFTPTSSDIFYINLNFVAVQFGQFDQDKSKVKSGIRQVSKEKHNLVMLVKTEIFG